MTTKQMKQMKALIKSFNAHYMERDKKKKYDVNFMHFGRNRYSAEIHFKGIFNSIDLGKLIKFAQENDCSFFIGSMQTVHVI